MSFFDLTEEFSFFFLFQDLEPMLLIAGIRNKTQVFSGNFSKFQLAFSLHFDRYRIWNLDFWKSDFLKRRKKKG